MRLWRWDGMWFDVVLLTLILPGVLSAWCPENCRCDRSSTGDLEVVCPADQEAGRIAVDVRPEVQVRVQCTLSARAEDWALLEGLQTGPASTVTILYCPLPHTSFHNLTQSWGVSSVSTLIFQSFSNLSNQLQYMHLQGMTQLTRLRLNSNGLTDLSADLLKDLRNLTTLDLRDNFVHLPETFLSYAPQLISLELGTNRLTSLEPNLFQSSQNLKLLNLWSNKLTHLIGSEFLNLTKLELLDLHSNQLEFLPADIFRDLTNLKKLNLFGNDFATLPDDLLLTTTRLEVLKLSNNLRTLNLPAKLFSNLSGLKEVYLMRNEMKDVPEDLFKGATALINISLSGNLLESLPVGLLRDQSKLVDLDLSSNRLENLPDELFRGLKQLKILRLGLNNLTRISRNLFAGLNNLEQLHMEKNQLSLIDSSAFRDLFNLRVAQFSSNNLTFLHSGHGGLEAWDVVRSPFHMCVEMQHLYLANNSISAIFEDWSLIMTRLRTLDLKYNKLRLLQGADLQFLSREVTVDLRHNMIAHIGILSFAETENSKVPRVLLASNPFFCNCNAYDLARYVAHTLPSEVYGAVRLELEGLRCMYPEALRGRAVLDVRPDELICPVDGNVLCPRACDCTFRQADTALLINCSSRGLTQVPDQLPIYSSANHTELFLENNLLTQLPEVSSSYNNITHLYLARNQLTELPAAMLNSNLTVLTVDHNNLTHVPMPSLLKLVTMTNLRLVTLHANPWQCDCHAKDFVIWMQKKFKLVSFLSNVTCADGRALSKLSAGELCPAPLGLVIFCITAASIGVLGGMLAALYYRYHHEIRVWMYAHRCCLWLVTEEELDRDKRYDAFISFSHKDEDFVVRELVPRLEACGLTLCLHYRDWVAGEWIPSQIARSVEASRRTLVVLSPNFLDSVWGRLEFRAAHKQALSEGRARVVMLLYGELPPSEQLEPELRAYISVNTYVKWGDPWFWDKLRYALPHAPLPASQMKQKSFDDKIELMHPMDSPTAVPTTPPGLVTTPPTLTSPVLQSPVAIA